MDTPEWMKKKSLPLRPRSTLKNLMRPWPCTRTGNFPDALHKIENALSVINYADKTEDFGELTKLAVDASFKIGNYEKAVFHQEKLLNSLGESAEVEEKSETLYRLGILYSRLERFDVATQHLEAAIDLWTQAEELDRLAEGIATLGSGSRKHGCLFGCVDRFYPFF